MNILRPVKHGFYDPDLYPGGPTIAEDLRYLIDGDSHVDCSIVCPRTDVLVVQLEEGNT